MCFLGSSDIDWSFFFGKSSKARSFGFQMRIGFRRKVYDICDRKPSEAVHWKVLGVELPYMMNCSSVVNLSIHQYIKDRILCTRTLKDDCLISLPITTLVVAWEWTVIWIRTGRSMILHDLIGITWDYKNLSQIGRLWGADLLVIVMAFKPWGKPAWSTWPSGDFRGVTFDAFDVW